MCTRTTFRKQVKIFQNWFFNDFDNKYKLYVLLEAWNSELPFFLAN